MFSKMSAGVPTESHVRRNSFYKILFWFLGGEEFNPEVPDQVLVAEDLPSVGVKTFGYSLGGGYDLDLNNHSDITVGAFGSDMAFVVRSRQGLLYFRIN